MTEHKSDGADKLRSVDMTPTPDGFGMIGATFVQQVLADVHKNRKTPDAALLGEIVKIAAMLGRNGHDDAVRRMVLAAEQADR